jgi:tetratricopeptide (TPR) repeat protein
LALNTDAGAVADVGAAGAAAAAGAGAAVAVAVASTSTSRSTGKSTTKSTKKKATSDGEGAGEARPEARGGGSARSFLKAGRRAYEDDDLPGALEKLRAALRLNPGLADAYILLGTVYKKMGEKQRALASFKKYLEVAPDGDEAAVARTNISELQE